MPVAPEDKSVAPEDEPGTPKFIEADWPAPPGILALATTRRGGCSSSPYDTFNLASHVGDRLENVETNRARLGQALGLANPVSWLNQVHGVSVVPAGPSADGVDADAVWTDQPGITCAVLTADCLPVLFCSENGSCVAAAHAGWRGLAGGVLEAVVAAMPTAAENLLAWLGPAIGPVAFEVGAEVREAFMPESNKERSSIEECFISSGSRPGHYYADLYALARLRLAACGVTRIYGGEECTYTDAERFFSYRRDGDTGRMASVIQISP